MMNSKITTTINPDLDLFINYDLSKTDKKSRMIYKNC